MRFLLTITIILIFLTVCAQQPFNQNGLWGIKKDGAWLVTPSYDRILPQKSGYFITKKDDLYGLITPDGTLSLKPTYTSLYQGDDEHWVFASGGRMNYIQGELIDAKYGLMKLNGEMVIEPHFHRIYMAHGLLNVQVNDNWGHWGILDSEGNVLLDTIHPSFSFDMRPHSPISVLDKSYVIIKEDNSKWKILNVYTKKYKVVEHNDFWGPNFLGEHAVLHSKNMVINTSGKRISKPGLTDFYLFEEGHFLARSNEQANWELYNAIGQRQKALEQLDYVINFKQKYGLVKTKNGQYGVMNTQGELTYLSADTLKSTSSDGYFIQKQGRLNHIVNYKGRRLGKSMSLMIKDYYHDFKVLSVNGLMKYGQILYNSKTGQKLTDLEIRFISEKGKYLYCESYGQAKFYINRDGEVLGTFEPKYEFKRGHRNKWGLKNVTNGDWIVPPNYLVRNEINDSTFHLMNNRYLSSSDSVLILRKENGGIRIEACDMVTSKSYAANKRNYLLKHNRQYGIMNNDFRLIVPFIADSVELGYRSHKVFIQGDQYIYSDKGALIAKNQVLHKAYDHYYHLKDTIQKIDRLYRKDGKEVYRGEIKMLRALHNGAMSIYDGRNKQYYLITPEATVATQTDYVVKEYVSPEIIGGNGGYICSNGKSKFSSKHRLGLMLPNGEMLIQPRKYVSRNRSSAPFLIMFGKKNDVIIRDIESNPGGTVYKDIKVLYNISRSRTDWEFAYRVGQKGAYQIYNNDFTPINDIVYKDVDGFRTRNFLVRKTDDRYYLIDNSGKDILGNSFVDADVYDDMIALKDDNGMYHLYNSQGVPIVEEPVDKYNFDYFYADNGMVEVKKDNKAYMYYEEGELVAGPVDGFFFLDFDYFDEGYIGVKKDGKVNLLGLYGSESFVFDEYYDDINYFEAEDIAAVVRKGDKYGVIDLQNKVRLPVDYDEIKLFEVEDEEGRVGIAKKGDQEWYLTYDLKLVP